MCDSNYEHLMREYNVFAKATPDSLLYSYETAYGLNDAYNYTIDDCQAFTISTSKIYSTTKDFMAFIKKFFKNLNLNALIYGVCERHPNRKGLHMHLIMFSKEKLTYLKYKGIYLFETFINNLMGALAYIRYMFKEKPIKSIFSKYNLYEEGIEDIEKIVSETEENLQATLQSNSEV